MAQLKLYEVSPTFITYESRLKRMLELRKIDATLYIIYFDVYNYFVEDEEYYDTDDGSEIIEDFNEVTEDLYADFPPTDPQYAYQNVATGEVVGASRPTRPPRPKRPNRRPQFSRPHRPASKPPVIETFEDIGVNNFPLSSGGNYLHIVILHKSTLILAVSLTSMMINSIFPFQLKIPSLEIHLVIPMRFPLHQSP